ncbi:MAG: dihydroorotate dehydrogenase [Thermodesulfobacteriota bacterium]
MQLALSICGLELKNPVLTASGTFGYGLEFSAYGDLSSLGGIVVKGLSLQPRQGNSQPRMLETSCGFLNSIGLQNIGATNFVEQKLPFLPWEETAIIANLYAQSREEFAELALYLSQQTGIAALEVNISCPNVQSGGLQFGQDPEAAALACKAVKSQAGEKPVIVKLSPNVGDITEIALAVQEAGADCISLINTLQGMAVDIRTRKPQLQSTYGGLSGPAIKPVALRMAHQVCSRVDIPVIGLGGISSAEDILEFILVGAHAVQVGSANFIRPDMSFRLTQELQKLCQELGISSWEEIRGQLKTG